MSEQHTRVGDGEGLEIATPEDFGIVRDETGELKPVRQRIPGTKKAVLVRPVIDLEPVADVLEANNPPDARVDEVAEKYVVEGLGSDGDLSALPDYLINGVLQAIKDSSGHQVFQAVQERRLQEEASVIENIGVEQAQELAKIAREQQEANGTSESNP